MLLAVLFIGQFPACLMTYREKIGTSAYYIDVILNKAQVKTYILIEIVPLIQECG